MAEEHDNMMVGKPLFDILSKLPSKSLLHFRCVSKLWCEYIDDSYFVSVHDKQVIEDPTPIIFSSNNYTLCFHEIESYNNTNHVLKAKNNPVFEFVDEKLLSKNVFFKFLGSCNGLFLIETEEHYIDADADLTPFFSVIHPINKQCYLLPFFQICEERESCGLGFDSSTNTFKMVCVYHNREYPNLRASKAHWAMVHVFGTNSWRTIPQVPSYGIYDEAIFAHGCLHWLATDAARHIISFDVKSEEFGLIEGPKRNNFSPFRGDLVNLDGHVRYFGNDRTVWLLNDKKEWTLHCDFKDHKFPHNIVLKVLGCLNKDGDILIKATKRIKKEYPFMSECFMFNRKPLCSEWLYIYNLKNRVMHEARIDGLDLRDGHETEIEIVMFPNRLCDIITNSNLIKKRDLHTVNDSHEVEESDDELG